jgi:hypothetical protein
MSLLVPPPSPPLVTLADDGSRRLYSRLRLVSLTAITIIVTAWVCTMGLVPAILALAVAKHVLVAILAMGLGVDAKRSAPV